MAGIPTQISPEAQAAAELIDQVLEDLLAECGLPRVRRTGATIKAVAATVQWAIDQRMERADA